MKIRDRIKDFRRVKASDLTPNPRNWRSHPPAQQDALRGVLAEIGYADALLVRELDDGTLGLVDGHLRAETTPDQEVPVLVLDLSEAEAEARKLMVTLDPLAGMAEANKDALGELIAECETESEAVQAMLDGLAKENGIDLFEGTAGQCDPDEVPEPPEEPVTKPGNLWLLGDHRLLCGDSTKAEDVERVMGGEKAKMLWTDPPYGVAYIGGFGHQFSPEQRKAMGGMEVKNDNLNENELRRLLLDAFDLANRNSNAGAAWYVTAPAGPLHNVFGEVLKELGVWRRSLIWLKSSFVMGRGDYHYRHEPIFYGWTPGAGHYFRDTHSEDSVFEYDRPTQSENHPIIKPLGLVAECIVNSSRKAWLVYDPFLGSGTTIIAAEQLGRRCFGMEVEPKYCDVIVARWEKFTGKKAELEKPHADD